MFVFFFLHPEVIALSSILSFFLPSLIPSFKPFYLLSVLPSFLSFSFLNSLLPTFLPSFLSFFLCFFLSNGLCEANGSLKLKVFFWKLRGNELQWGAASLLIYLRARSRRLKRWRTGKQTISRQWAFLRAPKVTAETPRPRTELNLLGFADVSETCSDSVLFMEGLSKSCN